MKLSIDWLREYLDFDCSLEQLADALTMAGLEVEEIIRIPREEFAARGGSGATDDVVLDVKVTPNRGDWLSVVGVAREAAPLVGGKLRKPEPEVDGTAPASSDMIRISIEEPDLCGRYVGVVVRGVKIKDSPDWMRDRLIAAGMRPINNVVDITNYVMLEMGQPLHAFDYSLLYGKQIIVRTARPGETITSIDGEERRLEPDMLVIADADRAVAIAGVMGGEDSEVSKQAEDIMIESANFSSTSIRRTSKRLGLVTESSYRFERGVDPSITDTAALRAAELMRDLADGEVALGIVDARPRQVDPLRVELRPERANAVLGTNLDAAAMSGLLSGLGIEPSIEGGRLACIVPTFRQDVTREIDLIEEIGRAYGYDRLEMTLPDAPLQGKDSAEGAFTAKLRRVLMSCGMQEVLTHSLVSSELAGLACKSANCVKLRNPLSEDLDAMRVGLVPNLLQVIERNQAFGTSDVSVFEIGRVYQVAPDGEIGERLSVAGAMTGSAWGTAWSLPGEALAADFFLLKGVVESLLDGLGIEAAEFVETRDPLLHATRTARVLLGDKEVGILGEVSPEVREALDLRGRPYAFELDFETLMAAAPRVLRYQQLPRYPALYRHMAVVVTDDTKYQQLTAIIRDSGGNVIENVDLLDVYKGEHIGPNQRSLTISITFRSREKTLTDDEVNTVLATTKQALSAKAGASFR